MEHCPFKGIRIPQMTTSRSRCFTVTRFIKQPIKKIFSENLIIANSDNFFDMRQEITPLTKIAINSIQFFICHSSITTV